VTINVTNGSGQYTYSIPGPVITGLASGPYTVTITDDVTACTTEVSFVLTDDVAGATITVDPLELACAGAEDGTVIYTVNYDPAFATPATEMIIDATGTPVTNGTLSAGTYSTVII